MNNNELAITAVMTVSQLLQNQLSTNAENGNTNIEYMSLKKMIKTVNFYQFNIKNVSDDLYDEAKQTIEYLNKLNDMSYQLFLNDVKMTIALWQKMI